MACLIKSPSENHKGVVSFTTAERDNLILGDADLISKIVKLKERFAVGVHHNWHDFEFQYNPLFDFHLAGEEDLIAKDGSPIPLIPMDACNFSPPFFAPADTEKFWDVLFVARAVKFKGIPEFFQAVRTLYDRGEMLRILFVCPVPPKSSHSEKNVRELYESFFPLQHEQQLFTFLTIEFNYPFPFDLQTLGHFYRSSRIFVHSAADERRCRVAAYAWATGLPVVGKACIGSILPPPLRTPPYFYEIDGYSEFPDAIQAALETAGKRPDFSAVRNEVASQKSIRRFNEYLHQIFASRGWTPPQHELIAGQNLDLRLGRHHGLAFGMNNINQDICSFVDLLTSLPNADVDEIILYPDPEIFLAKKYPSAPRDKASPYKKMSRKMLSLVQRSRRN